MRVIIIGHTILLVVATAGCHLVAADKGPSGDRDDESQRLLAKEIGTTGAPDWCKRLLPDAGKVTHGAMATARLLPGQGANLAVLVRNVGRTPVRFRPLFGPIAYVSDSAGKFAKLTPRGRDTVGQDSMPGGIFGGGDTRGHVYKPGETEGDVVSLTKYYGLSKPGTYTAVAAWWVIYVDFGYGDALVTEPLVFKVEKEAAGTKVSVVSARPKPGKPSSPVEPKDRQWSRLAADGGVPAKDFRLEAVPRATRDGVPYLVASLVCIDEMAGRDGADYVRVDTGRDAADYDVVVRDAEGKPVRRLTPAKAADSKRATQGTKTDPMVFGRGVGAVIPLAEWFDMKRPGKYSVLLWLPSSDPNRPLWVAEPVTVTVPK